MSGLWPFVYYERQYETTSEFDPWNAFSPCLSLCYSYFDFATESAHKFSISIPGNLSTSFANLLGHYILLCLGMSVSPLLAYVPDVGFCVQRRSHMVALVPTNLPGESKAFTSDPGCYFFLLTSPECWNVFKIWPINCLTNYMREYYHLRICPYLSVQVGISYVHGSPYLSSPLNLSKLDPPGKLLRMKSTNIICNRTTNTDIRKLQRCLSINISSLSCK